jgi:nicotinamidase-related amidase
VEQDQVMSSLLEESDSVLCVIDVQPGFLHKLEPAIADETVHRIRWLIQVAGAMSMPILVTEENPFGNGPTVDRIVAALPPGTARMNKAVFGLADQPDIRDAVSATGRATTVLCGLETDVCVAHSALGLSDIGYRVAVVTDAVASPGSGQSLGLSRMRNAGITLLGAKGLAYEWLRTVERTEQLDEVLGKDVPLGVIL